MRVLKGCFLCLSAAFSATLMLFAQVIDAQPCTEQNHRKSQGSSAASTA